MVDVRIKTCSSCGEALETEDAFCTNCGSRIEAKPPQKAGESPIGEQLLALANDFLSVSEVSPERFEFASQSGAQASGQKVTIKYQAVALLEPEKKLLMFWEKMVESLVGIDAGFSHESTIQKGIEVNQKIHGQLMFGGPYGFQYDRLHRVVKAITSEQGWQFKPVMSKPAMNKSLPANEDHEKMLSDKGIESGASIETNRVTSHRNTAKKRRWIPLALTGAAILMVTVILVGVLSKGGKETHIAEKPKTVVVPHQVTNTAKPVIVEQTPAVAAISNVVDYNTEGIKKAQTGRMEEAAVLFEKAVQADPNHFNAWNNLGLALRKIGKEEEAIKAYQRAISVKPDFALVYKNLGIVLEQMNKNKEAAEAYRKYAELNPTASDAQTAKEKADMLMGSGQGKGVNK